MNTVDAKRILETALICSPQPLSVRDLRVLFNDELGADTVKSLLESLQQDWAQRGVELVAVASGWRFQSRPELREYLDRLHPEKPPKYTRAAMETLAIIAYRQPVTRGDIEDLRGVSVSPNIMRTLQERDWIRVVGEREAPGRPALYGTTRAFLDYFNLRSLDQLPPLPEIRALLENAAAADGTLDAPGADRADVPTDVHADAAVTHAGTDDAVPAVRDDDANPVVVP